ncbi:MAG: hypothetical protein HY403_06475 [Elusimicrobia bacterium]|nr:hypothetical protein [Elusimicrobiota bacterium]
MKPLIFSTVLVLLAGPAVAQVTLEQVREEIGKAISHSTPKPAPSVFNPAMGLVLDAIGQHTTPGQGAFKFRSAEINLDAAVDPRARLYAIINGTPDGVEVEEAAFVTTALPYNLTARGGRYFANFGRLAKRHDHELPFVERTASLDTFVNGEAQTEGLELTYLFRTPFFLQGTVGAGNKIGAENDRLQETDPVAQDGHKNGRPLASFTYNARLFTYAPLGEDWGIDLGLSEAYTPRHYYIGGVRADEGNNARSLSAADLTVRWEPLGDNVYRKALWSTEIFRNNERRRTAVLDPEGTAILDAAGNPLFTNTRKSAWGAVSSIDWRLSPHVSAGAFGDYAEDLDRRAKNTKTFGILLTGHVSEFQNIRLQLSRKRDNFGGKADSQVFVQYRAAIGSHAHTFKDR